MVATTPAGPTGFMEGMAGVDGSLLLRVSRHLEPAGGPETDLLVVCVRGAVDMDNAATLRMALRDSVAGHPLVCCDLSDVTFFAAAGVNALVDADNRARVAGCRLSVRGARGVVLRVLRITGVDRLITAEA